MTPHPRFRPGFTLIELLVVIARVCRSAGRSVVLANASTSVADKATTRRPCVARPPAADVAHIHRKGEDARVRNRRRARARRWVVERAHSWTNRARRLLIRWEKTAANYLAFVHLQFALTAWRVAGDLG